MIKVPVTRLISTAEILICLMDLVRVVTLGFSLKMGIVRDKVHPMDVFSIAKMEHVFNVKKESI